MCNGPLQTGVGTRGGLSVKLPGIKTLKISLKKQKAETRFFYVFVEIAFCSKQFNAMENLWYILQLWNLLHRKRELRKNSIFFKEDAKKGSIWFMPWRWSEFSCFSVDGGRVQNGHRAALQTSSGKSGVCQEKHFLEQGWKVLWSENFHPKMKIHSRVTDFSFKSPMLPPSLVAFYIFWASSQVTLKKFKNSCCEVKKSSVFTLLQFYPLWLFVLKIQYFFQNFPLKFCVLRSHAVLLFCYNLHHY